MNDDSYNVIDGKNPSMYGILVAYAKVKHGLIGMNRWPWI